VQARAGNALRVKRPSPAQVIDLTFLHGAARPTIAVLYQASGHALACGARA